MHGEDIEISTYCLTGKTKLINVVSYHLQRYSLVGRVHWRSQRSYISGCSAAAVSDNAHPFVTMFIARHKRSMLILRSSLWLRKQALTMFYHRRLPIRYFLLCCFMAMTLWLFFNLMSFIYVGERRKHLSPNTARDLLVSTNIFPDSDTEDIGLIRSDEDKRVRQLGYSRHAFNELISNRLGFHRSIEDTRHELCRTKTYSSAGLPSASVIICFHNEAWSTLLRTVHSIFDRTPEHLLHEIILVDDYSSYDHLKGQLKGYIENYPKIHLLQTDKREGLIRGRMKGAQAATGHVLVFLDSHCEVNTDWLQPLLHRIKENPETVVCPIIDIISSDTFEYKSSPLVRGGFNWGLHFAWEPLSPDLLTKPEDHVQPIRSPTMAGGLFGISRKYFYHLGQYDPGMDIWGAENLEISFRIWMCGGRLEIIPCSRVGHTFRKWRPYSSDKGDTMAWNSMRLAEVWMDEYKKYFYETKPGLLGKPFGDISSRLELRKNLKCHSFQWFLDNVYPEMTDKKAMWKMSPKKEVAIMWKGRLQNVGKKLFCLDSPGRSSEKKASAVLNKCQYTNSDFWAFTKNNELKIDSLLCLDVIRDDTVRLMKCHGEGGTQEWRYKKNSFTLYNPASGSCLDASDKGHAKMEICSGSTSQMWHVSYD